MGLGARQQFGRYVAIPSHLHALDPLIKVAGFIVLVISIFLASTWPGLGAVAVYIIALVAASRVRLAFYGETLK
jgi:energy-coupling factor transporter transmembrane protein EcfT